MAISDAQFTLWLNDQTAQRVVLFDATVVSGGISTPRYFSTKPFSGLSSAKPYLPIVRGGLRLTESISMDADAVLNAGDIELSNFGGQYDSWLDDVWVNAPITGWVGDVRWPRSDFRQIFSGVASDINSKDRNSLNIMLRDKMQRLNTPVTDSKMAGSAPNADTLHPTLVGEVHNLSPKLKDPNNQGGEYEFNYTGSERLIEVRVDAKPRSTVTANLTVGSFTFQTAVGPGTVTCSAQGVKPSGTYSNKIADLIQYLVTQMGNSANRFSTGDLDTANLSQFNTTNAQPVGLYIPDRMNVIEACRLLASSVGAQMVISRTGLLRLIQFSIPTSATTEIHETEQINKSIKIVGRSKVEAAVKIGYCKNWTVQTNLQTSIPDAHKELFAEEWLSYTASDSATQTLYKLAQEPVMIETCLQVLADAQAEATRRLNVVKQPRTTYQFEGSPAEMLLELGQPVKLFSSRFNLSSGKVGLVTSLSPDWGNLHVTVEVTV